MNRTRAFRALLSPFTLVLAALLVPSHLSAEPIADVHMHWKWSQKEVTTVEQAVAALRSNDIALAVITGTPPELALELAEAAPEVVVPIVGIYRYTGHWSRWHRDPKVLERTRELLETGRFHGIGEVHLIAGFISNWQAPVIDGLFRLAAEFDVPVLVHTEFSRANYLMELCAAHPDTRMLWAHAGAILPPTEVKRVIDSCPNVWVELSARDPWRFVAKPISDDSGHLLPDWRELVLAYPDRFMVGSDPVWPVEQLDGWDQPDTGWQELDRFLGFHRTWIDDLPPEAAERIRLTNARALFRTVAP
jgi:predicted TIM-barrel fold metal-dependent hydrolase